MKERIALLMREKSLSASSLAEILGVQASGISHILSGRNNPSLDFIIRLLTNFPEVNSDWFILGNGGMYKSQEIIENKTSKEEANTHNQATDNTLIINNPPHEVNNNDSISSFSEPANDLFSLKNNQTIEISGNHTDLSDNQIKKTFSGNAEELCDRNTSIQHHLQIRNKSIRRVMIFYTDHTVDNYDYKEDK